MSSAAITSLQKFAADLRRLGSQETANKIAAAAAPVLTALVQETFAAGENAYGLTWAPGAEGQHITLRGKTSDLFKGLVYRATGSKLRLQLSVRYAKYQVGKRPVTPAQGAPLPVAYSEALTRTAVKVIKEELGR